MKKTDEVKSITKEPTDSLPPVRIHGREPKELPPVRIHRAEEYFDPSKPPKVRKAMQ